MKPPFRRGLTLLGDGISATLAVAPDDIWLCPTVNDAAISQDFDPSTVHSGW